MLNFGLSLGSTSNVISGFVPGEFAPLWVEANQEPDSLISLYPVTITGIPDNSTVTASAGVTFLINGVTATTMSEDDVISAFVTSGAYEAVVTGTVTINGIACAISVTSMAEVMFIDEMSQSVLDAMSQDDIDVLQQFGA